MALSTRDIMGFDWETINNLSFNELKSYTQTIGHTVNRQVKRLEANKELAGLSKPAIEALKNSGGLIRTKGITDVNKLREEFARAQRYLDYKTGTVTKYKAELKKTEDRLNAFINRERAKQGLDPLKRIKMSPSQLSKFYEVLHKAKEAKPQLFQRSFSYLGVMQDIAERIVGTKRRMDADEILKIIFEEAEQRYEEILEQEAEDEYEAACGIGFGEAF